MIRKKIYRWHRILSIISMIPVLMWTTSALLHQANKYVRPQVNNLPVKGRFSDPNEKVIAIANTIKVDGTIKELNSITSFNKEYPASQMVLPVMQVKFNDHLGSVAYIDPAGGRVIRTANDNSRMIHKWFGYLHAYKFIPGDLLRATIVMVLSLITLFTALSGFYVYFILKKRRANSRKAKWMNIHRFSGIMMGLFLVTFSFSGFLHSLADFVPAMEGFEKKVFSYVHMLKFFPSSLEPARFWLLTLLAALLLLMLVTGLILVVFFISRKIKNNLGQFRMAKLIDYGRLSG